jgi:hypothetical protein
VTFSSFFSKELMYQNILYGFAEMGTIKLSSPAPLTPLCMMALDHPRSGWEPQDGDKETIAEVSKLQISHHHKSNTHTHKYSFGIHCCVCVCVCV